LPPSTYASQPPLPLATIFEPSSLTTLVCVESSTHAMSFDSEVSQVGYPLSMETTGKRAKPPRGTREICQSAAVIALVASMVNVSVIQPVAESAEMSLVMPAFTFVVSGLPLRTK